MWAQKLWDMGLVALQHTESPRTRDQTRVPCTGRWILHHYTTGKVQKSISIVCKPPTLWNFQTKTEDREEKEASIECNQGGDHCRQPVSSHWGCPDAGVGGCTEQVPPAGRGSAGIYPPVPTCHWASCFFKH